MSCCSHSIDEARHERLKALADSINETARMARATVALLLTAALYLGITLLSSTDENLLLNAQVAVLQVGFGMALEQSYIFGPPIFLYLHVQGLFLLSILARKVQEFNDALDRELAGIPDSRRVRQEYWNWLSAFAFVQRFRDGHFHFVQRSLMWISMEAIPLLLLLAVDLSFVRYQSEWITNSHHVVFILDFWFIIWFNSLGFERSLRSLWSNLGRLVFAGIMILFLWYEVQPPSFDIKSVEKIALDIENQKDETTPEISTREIFEGVMIQRRNRIWRMDDEIELSDEMKNIIDKYKRQSKSSSDFLYKWEKREGFLQDVWKAVQKQDVSVLDIGPCQWWGLACRYLSVKGLWLVSTRPADVSISKIDESDEGNSGFIQWSSLNELSLTDRNLRFADLRFSELQGVNLEDAELQGANLERADLRDADLYRAKMDGTLLSGAKLQDANLSEAKLRSANLQRAQLQRAVLNGAKLWNAYLKEAELQRADFSETELQGANMESTSMDGATLFEAKLTCTNLQKAQLRVTSFLLAKLLGTDLEHAQLQGAKFQSAKLLGTNLAKSQLEGVDFREAEIRNSFGMPESWKLAWMYKSNIRMDDDPTSLFTYENLAKEYKEYEDLESDIPVFWIQEDDLQEIQGGDLQDCVTNISKTSGDWLSKDALPKGGWVVFDEMSDGIHHFDGIPHSAPGYRKAWAKWTVGFACKNEHTGYSSVKRWNSKDPLSGLKDLICPTSNDQAEQCETLDEMKKFILGKLDKATKCDQCPGLRTVPDGGWEISDGDWPKIRKDDD